GEEGGQPVGAGDVEHPVGAALGHAGHVGDGDGEEVQHVGERGAVEVAVGFHAPVVEEHGVVDGGGEFGVGGGFGVADGVAGGPVHLGCAAQRVGVLDAGAVGSAVAGDDGGVGEEGAHPGGGEGLPRGGARGLQGGGERPVGAQEGFHAHGGGEVGDVDQGGQVVQGEDEHAEHAFGAVGEGEAFFFAQGDGFEAGFGECFGGGAALPAGGEDFT